jgi:arylformamidase
MTTTQQAPTWLDSMYNNRALVPDYATYFEKWQRASASARSSQPCVLDVAYGIAAGEKLDIFVAPAANAPVMVFIHGGYLRSLDKSDHSFIAPTFNANGACVVIINYDLCPKVTIPAITMQTVRALAWVYRHIAQHGGDAGRISVVGHSAGGHLAAMLMACQWKRFADDLPHDVVKGALSMSGLYELDSVMQTPFLKDSLRLTPEEVLRVSPAWMPTPEHGRLFTVAGAEESPEFLRHNQLIQQSWGIKTVPVCATLPGLNHFSVLDALIQPSHTLHEYGVTLLKGL